MDYVQLKRNVILGELERHMLSTNESTWKTKRKKVKSKRVKTKKVSRVSQKRKTRKTKRMK